ncbi:MAG TPA: type II secretion system secretin GspD [Propylenella sp.]
MAVRLKKYGLGQGVCLMSPDRSRSSFIALIAAALLLSACATGGGPGFGNLASIFDQDLSAREPVEPPAENAGNVMTLGTGAVVYHGAGESADGSNQTISSFEPGEFNLNFQNADIREVIQSILGDALKENYTIDPNISGSVTISTARPISREHLLSALEIVLQFNAASLVKDGGVYRVVQEDFAVSGGADLGEARPGYGISILPLRYVSAQTLISLIEGFGARPGALRAEAARNLLVVLGNAPDRRAAIETAMTFDADWMQDQSVAILPLRHAKPETVIPELERIFAAAQGGVGANLVQFMPMQRLKAVLIVSPRRNLIERARTWVQRLDSENPDLESNVTVYRVKYRDAAKLVQILNGLFAEAGGLTPESPTEQVEPGAEPLLSEGMTSGFGAQQNQPEEGDLVAGQEPAEPAPLGPAGEEEPAEQAFGAHGQTRIQADISNNSIVIYADLETRQKVLDALRRIDVPQLQVAINVTMAEIRLTDELRYGIQYFLKSKNFGLGNDEGSIGLFSTLADNIGRELPGFNFVLGTERSPDIVIDAFDSITDVQVLSSPSLVVVENETAKFQVGDEIPIVTRSVTTIEDPAAPVSNEIEYRDTGIILNIKPRIAENGVVNLAIGQEISSVVAGSAGLTPTIATRRVESTISVMDGQTVLLGGLISEQSAKERAGIPGLSRVPAIGNLFGRKSRFGVRNELVILIRPSVIRGGQDAQHVAEELRSRLWGLGASQAR